MNYLSTGDFTGFSFFFAAMVLLASTVFFILERDSVGGKWKLSLSVATLITGIAAVHYYYMKSFWLQTLTSPTEIRYIDWILTVPLMCVEFYLILRVLGPVSRNILYRLLGFSTLMLIFGYLGESGMFNPMLAFGIGMLMWALVLYEIFMGQAAKIAAVSDSSNLKYTFNFLRVFILIGWIIYPLGYYLGTIGMSESLNVFYNIADIINKVGFSFMIYLLARKESLNE